jgi:ribosomal protein L17
MSWRKGPTRNARIDVRPCVRNRNLVTSLLHHEQIQTTVPKAKEAARLAEKVGHWLILVAASNLRLTNDLLSFR